MFSPALFRLVVNMKMIEDYFFFGLSVDVNLGERMRNVKETRIVFFVPRLDWERDGIIVLSFLITFIYLFIIYLFTEISVSN